MNAVREQARSTRPSAPVSASQPTQHDRWSALAEPEPLVMAPRFKLREVLGQGGMGSVYRAYDAELGIDVALKTLRGLDHESRTWLKAEFRALAGIMHPNLVQLYDLVIDEQSSFFTMELVRGRELVQHVRQSPNPGETLREVGRQLALAVASLHQAGKLHRDVKPSNVLVTDAGRVVLLDFGLVQTLATAGNSERGTFAGTLEYMSPEQTWGKELSAASDWYSFGATLFEAGTGRLPIDGAPMEIAVAKRTAHDVRPSQHLPGIAPDLDDLVRRLLSLEPGARPSVDEILATLGGTTIDGVVSLPPSAAERSHAPFVGRTNELAALDEAFSAARTGKTVIVTVSGQSGIGKSELLRRYVERFERNGPALVLTGRCHPHEALPFNAFDEIVDGIARLLERETARTGTLLELPGAEALVRLFPALGRVPALETLQRGRGDEPLQETRRQAFGALRRLFGALGPDRTPVLWIDDLQWADSDSGMLLGELLRPPGQPSLLVVLSFRAEDRTRIAALDAVRRGPLAVPPEWVRELELGPLSEPDALELVNKLAPRAQGEQLSTLAREAEGSPFFLCEAARFLKDEPAEAAPAHIRVAELLEYRMRRLPPEARRLLELVAVSGSPLDHRTLLRAARLEVSEALHFRVLEQLSVVRTAPGSARMAEVYHHRIRDQILEALPASERRTHHGALAEALLASPSPSLQSVIEHFEDAGDLASVTRYIVPAAREAFDAFAFARAAALYRRALDLGVSELDPADLHTHLGHALGNAGRGRESGEAYEQAANLLDRLTDPDGGRLLALRRRAAEQFLQSGHDQQGVEAFQAALASQGEALPLTRNDAIRRALAVRMGNLLKSYDVRTRSEADTPPALIERFDTLWAVGMRIAMVNHAQANYLAARSLAVAFETREPGRLVRAMSHEASILALVGVGWFQRRADRLLAVAERLLSQSDNPYDRAISLGGRAAVEWLRGNWRNCVTLDDAACELVGRSSHGVSWEHALFEAWALSALAELGEFKELLARCRRSLEEAQERDDRYRARNCSLGQSTLAWLAADQPARALELAERAITWSMGDYTTQHYHHYLSVAQTLLYEGNGVAAWRRSVSEWPALEQNLFLRVACVRDELLHLRARTELAAAAALLAGADSADSPAPATLLAHARKAARALERHGLECGRGWANLVHAGADLLAGDPSHARRRLEEAVTRFDRCEMRAYENAARYCLGALVGGADGEAFRKRALDWFASEEVVSPLRFIALLAPGCLPPA